MNYQPLTNKEEFISWLENMAADLDGKAEDPNVKDIYPGSENGDVATSKDLVGNFLAYLKNEPVEIK